MRALSAIDVVARSIWTTLPAVAGLSAIAILVGIRFGLTTSGAIGLYFVLWWLVLFAILPVRVRSQAEDGVIVAGTEPGAPSSPALYERAIWTTIVTGLVFALVAAFFPLAGL